MKILKKTFLIFFFLNLYTVTSADIHYFKRGKELYDNKNYDEAKIKFEKDIVFNPKSEKSYLYLAKIFKKKDKNSLEENNLNTVILLNPKNEDALYQLVNLKIKKSNFSDARDLLSTFRKVCVKLCSSEKELKNKLNSSLNSK